MRCLIVSKTRAGNAVCVGALTTNGENLRLTEREGFPFLKINTAYEIGQVWDLTYTRCRDVQPPHVEDVLVTASVFQKAAYNDLAVRIPRVATVWRGGIESLFDGEIRGPTASGSGYIQGTVPNQSVGFWCPDVDLVGEYTGNGLYYHYEQFRAPYVGVARSSQRIPAGSLVRISLARWWKPLDTDDDFPSRCYLQVSGCY